MACIRVVVMDLPRMTREIVEELIATEPGMTVVAGPCPAIEVTEVVACTSAHVLIAGAADMEQDAVRAMVTRVPPVRVLALSEGSPSAHLFELIPAPIALGEASPASLLRAIGDPPADPHPTAGAEA